jgi:hypothetical protein
MNSGLSLVIAISTASIVVGLIWIVTALDRIARALERR